LARVRRIASRAFSRSLLPSALSSSSSGEKGLEAGAHLACLGDVAHADRPPLRFIAVEQAGTAPAVQDGCRFPAEIHGVTDTGIHAKAARRPQEMSGVSGKKGAPGTVTLGDHAVAGPRTHAQ
jgi:hypothetical protein